MSSDGQNALLGILSPNCLWVLRRSSSSFAPSHTGKIIKPFNLAVVWPICCSNIKDQIQQRQWQSHGLQLKSFAVHTSPFVNCKSQSQRLLLSYCFIPNWTSVKGKACSCQLNFSERESMQMLLLFVHAFLQFPFYGPGRRVASGTWQI